MRRGERGPAWTPAGSTGPRARGIGAGYVPVATGPDDVVSLSLMGAYPCPSSPLLVPCPCLESGPRRGALESLPRPGQSGLCPQMWTVVSCFEDIGLGSRGPYMCGNRAIALPSSRSPSWHGICIYPSRRQKRNASRGGNGNGRISRIRRTDDRDCARRSSDRDGRGRDPDSNGPGGILPSLSSGSASVSLDSAEGALNMRPTDVVREYLWFRLEYLYRVVVKGL